MIWQDFRDGPAQMRRRPLCFSGAHVTMRSQTKDAADLDAPFIDPACTEVRWTRVRGRPKSRTRRSCTPCLDKKSAGLQPDSVRTNEKMLQVNCAKKYA